MKKSKLAALINLASILSGCEVSIPEKEDNRGGNSALRAETEDNPRNLPCPTCGRENMLTSIDVSYGYQCREGILKWKNIVFIVGMS